ncbi:hypothetical protein [Mycolicibacterium sp. 120270]|nr:hypothetical protein [Mycolicibacterium sp. 120270]MDX1886825.1 hypothetical protein [Mycolicibacterium sp. 120270]
MALTAAGAIALTPLTIPSTAPANIAVPHAAAPPTIELAAAISPADIKALINNLNSAMNAVSATVTTAIGAPGQTLADALNSAVTLNTTLWDTLITATDNPTLGDVLKALKATSNSGLTRLATTAGSANTTFTLATGQVTDLLTSTLTGSLSAALQAVAGILNNPLSAAAYTALLTVPLDIAGLTINNALTTAGHDLAPAALRLGTTFVTGITAQITNALSGFNDLLDAVGDNSGNRLIDGALTAVQGIVSAPVTATIAGINGGTSALSNAATTALTRLTTRASAAVTTWIGNGTTPGALQAAIERIGTAPLAPASYADALSILVGAGSTTLTIAAGTAGTLASIPFSTAAKLTTTGADVITAFTSSAATAASGILQMAGQPVFVTGLPHVIAAGVNTAVNLAAFATATSLNAVALALDIGSAISNLTTRSAAALPPAASIPDTSALSAPRTVSLSITPTSTPDAAGTDAETGTAIVEPTPQDPAADDPQAPPTAQPTETPAAEHLTESPQPQTQPTDPVLDPDASTVTAPDPTPTTETTTGAADTEEGTTTTPATETDEPRTTRLTKPTATKNASETAADTGESTNDDDARATTRPSSPRHAQGTKKNGISVNDIKSRIDNDKPTAGDTGASDSSSPAAA